MSGAPAPITCFGCGTDNDPGSENCFRCGRGLFVLVQGSLLAGRYEILRLLGKGGMGLVYQALDKELDETVAVKVLRPEVGASPEMSARFRSEIKLARRVSHRNVCRIHEYGRDGYLTYIVMEFVDGGDLRQAVREHGAIPPAAAYGIAVQLAEGLQAIHDVGIVHRDLKTANVMIDKQGQVKLMDFGIAKSTLLDSAAGATLAGQIVGTPEYMSPEQARAEKVDLRSDIYSFGVILFELFSGDVPFRGETPVATLMMHLQASPPLAGALSHRMPAALIPILGKALAKTRDDRFSSARDLMEALRRAQELPTATASATWIMERPGPIRAPQEAQDRPLATPTTPLPALPPTAVRVQPAAPVPPTPIPRPVRTSVPQAPPVLRPSQARSSRGWIAGLALVVATIGATMGIWRLTRQTEAPPPEASLPPASVDTQPAPSAGTTLLAAPEPTTAPTTLPLPSPGARVPTPEREELPREAPPSRIPGPSPTRPAANVRQPGASASIAPAPDAADRTTVSEPTPPPVGRLQLRVVPWAEVSVDGVAAGTTPLKPLALPPGSHTVRLTHPGFRPLSRKVEIRAGQTTLLEIDLKFEAFPKQED